MALHNGDEGKALMFADKRRNEAKGCLKAAAIQLVLGSKLAFHGLSLC